MDVRYGQRYGITIMYHKKDIICYRLKLSSNRLNVYSTKYCPSYSKFAMDYHPIGAMPVGDFTSDTIAPKWLIKCIDEIISTSDSCTEIVDIWPSSAGEGGLGS
jgi:hypothetical protein